MKFHDAQLQRDHVAQPGGPRQLPLLHLSLLMTLGSHEWFIAIIVCLKHFMGRKASPSSGRR